MKTAEFKMIDPALATYMLSRNVSNRPLKMNRVNEYYQDMIRGRYKEGTAETIKMSDKNHLLDGQHRLTALVKAGVTLEFLVAEGLDESIFDVLDTGGNRSASDIFSLGEVPNYTQTSTMIRKYLNFKSGKHCDGSTRENVTNALLFESYNLRPDFYQEVIKLSQRLRVKSALVVDGSLISSFICFFSDRNEEQAISFMKELCREIPSTNPTIDTLYNVFVKDKMSNSKKINATSKHAFITKAWNAYRSNKVLKVFKFDSKNEEFPTAI